MAAAAASVECLFWRSLLRELVEGSGLGAEVDKAVRRTAPSFTNALSATSVSASLVAAGVADAASAFQATALPAATPCPLLEAVADLRVSSEHLFAILARAASEGGVALAASPGGGLTELVEDGSAPLQLGDAAVQPVFTCSAAQASASAAPCAACARPAVWRSVPAFMHVHTLLASAIPSELPITTWRAQSPPSSCFDESPPTAATAAAAGSATPRLFSPASWFAGHARVFHRVASAPEQHTVAVSADSPKPRTSSLPDTPAFDSLTDKPSLSVEAAPFDAAEVHAALLMRVHAAPRVHTFTCSEDELYNASLRRRAHDTLRKMFGGGDTPATADRMCEDVGALRVHEAWLRGSPTHSSDVYVTCAVFNDVCSNNMAQLDASSLVRAVVAPRCLVLCSRYPFFSWMQATACTIVNALQTANSNALQAAYARSRTLGVPNQLTLRGVVCSLTRDEHACMRALSVAAADRRTAIDAASQGAHSTDDALVAQMSVDALHTVETDIAALTDRIVARCTGDAVVQLNAMRANACTCSCAPGAACEHASATCVRTAMTLRVPAPGEVVCVPSFRLAASLRTHETHERRSRRASFDPSILRRAQSSSDSVSTPTLPRPAALHHRHARSDTVIPADSQSTFTRPKEPWRWLLRDRVATPRDGSPRHMPPALATLTHLVRAFTEDMPPILERQTRVGNLCRLGSGLQSAETSAALTQWALPTMVSLLDARSIAHVVTSMLTEQNIIFVAPPSAFGNDTLDVLSRCVLACTCLCAPLHWQQNLRPIAPASTAAALAHSGAEALVHANIMGCTAFSTSLDTDPSARDCTVVRLDAGLVKSTQEALASHLHMPGVDDLITALARATEAFKTPRSAPLLQATPAQRDACMQVASVTQEHVRWLLTHMFVAVAPRALVDDASAALLQTAGSDSPGRCDDAVRVNITLMPTLRDIQVATGDAGAFWRRFGSSLMLQQHVSMRYSRVLHTTLQGDVGVLLTSDCTDLIHGVIADVTAMTNTAPSTPEQEMPVGETPGSGSRYSSAVAVAIAANVQRALTQHVEGDEGVDVHLSDDDNEEEEEEGSEDRDGPAVEVDVATTDAPTPPRDNLTFLSPSWFARSFRLAGRSTTDEAAVADATTDTVAAAAAAAASPVSMNLQASMARVRRLFSVAFQAGHRLLQRLLGAGNLEKCREARLAARSSSACGSWWASH